MRNLLLILGTISLLFLIFCSPTPKYYNFSDNLHFKNIKESPYIKLYKDMQDRRESLNHWILYKDLSKESNMNIWASFSSSLILNQYNRALKRRLKFFYKEKELNYVPIENFEKGSWSFLESERTIFPDIDIGAKPYYIEFFLPRGLTLMEIEGELLSFGSTYLEITLDGAILYSIPVKERNVYHFYFLSNFGMNKIGFVSKKPFHLARVTLSSPQNTVLLSLPSTEHLSKNSCSLSYIPAPQDKITFPDPSQNKLLTRIFPENKIVLPIRNEIKNNELEIAWKGSKVKILLDGEIKKRNFEEGREESLRKKERDLNNLNKEKCSLNFHALLDKNPLKDGIIALISYEDQRLNDDNYPKENPFGILKKILFYDQSWNAILAPPRTILEFDVMIKKGNILDFGYTVLPIVGEGRRSNINFSIYFETGKSRRKIFSKDLNPAEPKDRDIFFERMELPVKGWKKGKLIFTTNYHKSNIGISTALCAWVNPNLYVKKNPKNTKNVILVSLDALRRDYVGIYTGDKELSPNLAELAKDSVVFENAYVQASWTIPSHVSILTGLNPNSHGTKGISKIPPHLITLPQIL